MLLVSFVNFFRAFCKMWEVRTRPWSKPLISRLIQIKLISLIVINWSAEGNEYCLNWKFRVFWVCNVLIHSAGKNRVCTVLIHVICKIFPLPHQQEFHFLSQQRSLERNVFFTTLPKSFIYFCNLFVWKSVCTFSLTFMAEFSHRFGNVRNKYCFNFCHFHFSFEFCSSFPSYFHV